VKIINVPSIIPYFAIPFLFDISRRGPYISINSVVLIDCGTPFECRPGVTIRTHRREGAGRHYLEESMNRKLTRLLWISLALVLVGSLIAWNTQTAGGTVRVIDVRWVGSNGTPMSGLLYVPQTATAETPAPGIVAIHGYINSRETQSGYAIEFARRGWVVLAADQTGHGFSGGAAFANGFGGPDALRYLRSLDIVDPDNIDRGGPGPR
jgi:hypothetical protein